MYSHSPFRYPGGKARLANFVKVLCIRNGLVGGHYAEPYAGGASVALALLFAEVAGTVHINDVDPGVMAFWSAVLYDTNRLCSLIETIPLSVEEWRRQRTIQRSCSAEVFERGFATFYLNRTNRSGIIGSGGVIGGIGQKGTWKVDARFPRQELIRRIRRIALYKARIKLTQLDALCFLKMVESELPPSSLVYLDPPYYVKGQGLYQNFYGPDDHAHVHAAVEALQVPWIVSYDNTEPIRSLYSTHKSIVYGIKYSAQHRHDGSEAMFFAPKLAVPDIPNPASIDADALRRLLAA
jgi:DNA adenine methylase